jgi:hypothetical protein
MSAAAILLVAVTALVTWNIARPDSNASDVATTVGGLDVAVFSPGAADAAANDSMQNRYVASSEDDVDAVYEKEIALLRRIVDERFAELDSATVAEVQKNLQIIDQAIADSRAALESDPRSRLLSRQLDRALEHKMALLRRVALL